MLNSWPLELSEEQEKVEVERQKLKNDVEEKREKLTQGIY